LGDGDDDQNHEELASIFREALLRERLGLVRLCLQD
jgi:hypothetical protein